MNTRHLLSTITLALMAMTAAAGNASPTKPVTSSNDHASIPFVNHGGIRDWRADDNRSMWIEGRNGQWYYAEMFGPCYGLNFAEHIGFVTAPDGSFDRFSSVYVDGQKCTIGSLRTSEPPVHRRARGQNDDEATRASAPPA